MTESDLPGEPSPEEEDVSLFDNDDVEADVEPGDEAPTGDTLTSEEVAEIEGQVAEIEIQNRGRSPDEQISVSPEEVS